MEPIDSQPSATIPPLLRTERRDDGIRVITLNRPDSAANLLDRPLFQQLGNLLDQLETDPTIKGLVFASAKPAIFIAGADLRSLRDTASREDVERLVELGQGTMRRIAAFPAPTAAAIHGACAGGGCELALACDWRVASDHRSTRIGLPETQLGLIPAWGGCTRLTRLLGPAAAADLILKGTLLPAGQALRRGLVDAVCAPEHLTGMAVRMIIERTSRSPGRFSTLPLRRLAAPAVEWMARRRLERNGVAAHYPAPGLALSVICRGAFKSAEEGFRLEKEAIMEAASTDVCSNLIRLFFLREKASKSPDRTSLPGRLAVIGAGVMGSGIAHWFSSRGSRVVLADMNPQQVGCGMSAVSALYRKGVKRRILTDPDARRGLDRISPAADKVPLPRIELAIEAAAEKLEVKQSIFRDLENRTGPETVLATNTSALSVTTIASVCAHPERVIGMHFFNPVHRMALVEIVPGEKTDPDVTRKAMDITRAAGKIPVTVADRPGFLVNRILMPALMEAVLLFEEGASIREIDGAMTAFGMPMGPLRLLDEVGVDVAGHVAKTLAAAYPDRMRSPEILAELMRRERLGVKTGRGFYHHRGRQASPSRKTGWMRRNVPDATPRSGVEIRERILYALINEAARCLEENVVASVEDLDLAMVLGTGFAPFRGGPLRYADTVGPARIVSRLSQLAKSESKRFTPCGSLAAMAERKETFYRDPDAARPDATST